MIAVEPNEKGDIIYGGGSYDGRFNVDPVLSSNGIRRTFMIVGLHPDPAEVLEIGLSSGSWTWVLAAYDRVKRLDVVEIGAEGPASHHRRQHAHRIQINHRQRRHRLSLPRLQSRPVLARPGGRKAAKLT